MQKFPISRFLSLIAVAVIAFNACGGGGGESSALSSWLLRWNQVALDAAGLDHTPGFGEQAGPTRLSRALAIVHIAMFDAVAAASGAYASYTGAVQVTEPVSIKAAISQAAFETLSDLYPLQASTFKTALDQDLEKLPEDELLTRGIALGKQIATAILALRADDGAALDSPAKYVFKNDPGAWRADPINPQQTPLGALWSGVRPFVIKSASQFRASSPPALASAEYAEAFAEVQRLGGDAITTPTERTAEQTEIGVFWGYDGTPKLGAPPRLYNQIAVQIGLEHGLEVEEFARLLALVNTAMADTAVAIWESKYVYNFWRPVTGIREAAEGTGPSRLGDGNSLTIVDQDFTPLGAPASNSSSPNFTPPFPAYPSGHAGFGGALFQILRSFFGTDDIGFTIISDEFDGKTLDNLGMARPVRPRSFESLSEAEEENGQSRIYLGIHWSFDKTAGIAQGRAVADFVFGNAFIPIE